MISGEIATDETSVHKFYKACPLQPQSPSRLSISCLTPRKPKCRTILTFEISTEAGVLSTFSFRDI